MRIDEIKLAISQDSDCVQSQDDGQFMEIEFPNNGVDNFIVIKTDRWAFSDIDEIREFCDQLIDRFQKQCGEEIAP